MSEEFDKRSEEFDKFKQIWYDVSIFFSFLF